MNEIILIQLIDDKILLANREEESEHNGFRKFNNPIVIASTINGRMILTIKPINYFVNEELTSINNNHIFSVHRIENKDMIDIYNKSYDYIKNNKKYLFDDIINNLKSIFNKQNEDNNVENESYNGIDKKNLH